MKLINRSWFISLCLTTTFILLYSVFNTSDYNPDMVWQSCVAEGILKIKFKPDHLFYNHMTSFIFDIWKAVGLPGRAHFALQITNAIFGGITVMMFFLILDRMRIHRSIAIFSSIMFGFIPWLWFHATDVETYAAAKMFFIITLYYILKLTKNKNLNTAYGSVVVISIFHAFATYINYIHVFLVPAVICAIYLFQRNMKIGFKDCFKVYILYGISITILVWVPYIYIAINYAGIDSVHSFLAWLTTPGYGWPAFSRMGVLYTPLKMASGFASWFTPFAIEGSTAKSVIFGDYTVTEFIKYNILAFPLAIISSTIQSFLIIYAICIKKSFFQKYYIEIIVFLCIILFYQAFHAYWGSWFMGFALPVYFMLLIIIYEICLFKHKVGVISIIFKYCIPLIVISSTLSAFLLSYIPSHNPENNHDLQETLELSKKVDPHDLIVSTGGDRISEYWDYFLSDHQVFRLYDYRGKGSKSERLEYMFTEADKTIIHTINSGGKVYVHRLYSDEDELIRPWNELLFFDIRRNDILEHFKKYKIKEALEVYGNTYWRIELEHSEN